MVFAQDAATLAARREAEERDRRMDAAMERLSEANLVQQQRITALINENNTLHRQLTELENRFRNSQVGAVTRDDLQKVYAKMGEIEKARQADKTLLTEQINKILDKVEEIAKRPPVIKVEAPSAPVRTDPKPSQTRDREKEKEKEKDKEPETAPDNPNGYYTYTIKSGDRLMAVIKAYNDELKDKNKKPITLDQVKKANPKMNPNNLVVGKEILIPVPPDK